MTEATCSDVHVCSGLVLPYLFFYPACSPISLVMYCRGEGGEVGSKKDLINTARLIAKESEEVVKMAKKVAEACTDKRMKRVRKERGKGEKLNGKRV